MNPGRCYGIGVGPGDPELLTVKAVRLLGSCPVVAYFSAPRRESNARRVVQQHLPAGHTELQLVYPVTTEAVAPATYETLLADFYDQSAKRVAEVLDEGLDVAVLCEGDPFFFGSYMYLHHRLRDRYPSEVVPGVSSALAGAAVLGSPLASRNERFTVLSGVLSAPELEAGIAGADSVVVIKVGRNLDKVRDAVRRAGVLDRAYYLEWATLPNQQVMPLADVDGASAPYFSMVVIPGVGATRR
jgi:precorrin-2/cobalt-factor-2 C20-methyltransferase